MPKLKVLHIMRSLDVGGIGMFAMNIWRQFDSNRVEFDFAIAYDSYGDFGQEILGKSGKIYFLSKKGNRGIVDAIKQIVELNKLLKREKYDVVHCHYYFANAIFLLIAKINHVKKRISHCHNTRTKKVLWIKKIFEDILRKLLLLVGTDFLGCSTEATKFLYGDKAFESGVAKVLFNGIDYKLWDKRRFDGDFLRKKYNVDTKCKILTFVGRFEEQKNPLYALKVVRKLYEVESKINLLMVGYGSYQAKIEKFIVDNNMSNYVRLLPQNTNIIEIQAISDVMVAPSYWEGLSIAFIEAQKMQTMVFTSTKVPDEIDMGYCEFLDLENIEAWVERIHNYLIQKDNERHYNDRLLLFNADKMAREVYSIYTK